MSDEQEFKLDTDQTYRLEAIAAQMMTPLLEQAKDIHMELEQAAFLAVDMARLVMNKARDCRLKDGQIVWRSVDA